MLLPEISPRKFNFIGGSAAHLEDVALPEGEVEQRHVAVKRLKADALDNERRAVLRLCAVVLVLGEPLCTASVDDDLVAFSLCNPEK